MKALFIIQGEGRGHMTQALALEQMLQETGHTVSCMLIGTSSRREVAPFFKSKAKASVKTFTSPNFYYDKNKKSIDLWKTVFYNLFGVFNFFFELRKIHSIVKEECPDVIINFYDMLGGFYFALYRPRTKRLCIAHQYLSYHQDFPFAKGYPIQKRCFQITNWLTSLNTHKKIALSFRPLSNTRKDLTIAPPLLREEIFGLSPTREGYILAYVVNQGYAYELMQWHQKNKKIRIHCFWDNKEKEEQWSPWKNLTFHHINDQKFLNYMQGCIGYVSTAGFESICEAMYLNKPVMMVPVERQYEQACNALDAVLAKAGIATDQFMLDGFLKYLSTHNPAYGHFNIWVRMTKAIIMKEIEEPLPRESKYFFWTSFSDLKIELNDR